VGRQGNRDNARGGHFCFAEWGRVSKSPQRLLEAPLSGEGTLGKRHLASGLLLDRSVGVMQEFWPEEILAIVMWLLTPLCEAAEQFLWLPRSAIMLSSGWVREVFVYR